MIVRDWFLYRGFDEDMLTGLSNRIKIESYFLIESKVFAYIECRSNRMKFSIFNTI
jgi:hypothetical protein